MALTPEKYQKLQALLADPEKDLSEDFRARAQEAVDTYRNDYLEQAQGPLTAEMPEQYDPGKTKQTVSQLGQAADEGRAQLLISQLDPAHSLPAQILALQPATTHPEGDEAAANEWLTGPIDNPAGRVIFYEPTARQMREELAANPALFRALQLSAPSSPEAVMALGEDSSEYQAYADYKWKQAGEAASKAGKTAYRFSKAPYLGEGPNAHWLDTLGTKLKAGALPAVEGLTAFVGGVDDAANIGLGGAMAPISELDNEGPPKLTPEEEASGKYAWHPTLGKIPKEWEKQGAGGKAIGAGNDEVMGGTTASLPDDASASEVAAAAEEAHPNLHTAGQVGGALMPSRWGGVAGPMWDWLMGQGATGVIKGALSGGARAGAAGAAEQTAREGVQAASSYVDTGDPGTTLEAAGGRVLGATASSVLPGVLGSGIRALGNQLTEGVQWGSRYGGAPGRVEAHGVETRLGRGHVAPGTVKEAELRGRKEGGRSALTVLASDLDEPLGDAARGRVSSAAQAQESAVAAHRASPEAGYTLPARNLVEEAAKRLRQLTSEIPRNRVKGVATPRADSEVKGIFNANIEGVSTRPTKNGVELSAEEARAFLSPEWQAKLDLDKLAQKGGSVYVTPRRYDSAHADEVIEQLSKSRNEHVQALHDAARRDRAGRGTGDYAKARDKHDKEIGEAQAGAKRIGADRPRGVRKTVEAVGKSSGQHEATPALRDAARRAGGDAPEKLRGALVAEDLERLRNWSSLGGRNPLASPLSLWGLTDKVILKGAYPAARQLDKLPTGGAQRAARLSETTTRNVMDSPADERREEREKKASEGYRERAKDAGAGKKTPRKKRRIVRRRVASSEAER